jgi:hypothetical protein
MCRPMPLLGRSLCRVLDWDSAGFAATVVTLSPWDSRAGCAGIVGYAACLPGAMVCSVAILVLGKDHDTASSIIAGTYRAT